MGEEPSERPQEERFCWRFASRMLQGRVWDLVLCTAFVNDLGKNRVNGRIAKLVSDRDFFGLDKKRGGKPCQGQRKLEGWAVGGRAER